MFGRTGGRRDRARAAHHCVLNAPTGPAVRPPAPVRHLRTRLGHLCWRRCWWACFASVCWGVVCCGEQELDAEACGAGSQSLGRAVRRSALEHALRPTHSGNTSCKSMRPLLPLPWQSAHRLPALRAALQPAQTSTPSDSATAHPLPGRRRSCLSKPASCISSYTMMLRSSRS
jgi:hypothetical protein